MIFGQPVHLNYVQSLDDTSQQVDTVIEGEKIFLQADVIVLVDKMQRAKQLNTAYSLESPVAIILIHVFFKLYNLHCHVLSRI